MPFKRIRHDEFGDITLQKLKNSRGLRITIAHNGKIRLTMPRWIPYAVGIKFINDNHNWLKTKQQKRLLLKDKDLIGKQHKLLFSEQDNLKKSKAHIDKGIINIKTPAGRIINDSDIQETASKACVRALKNESKNLLIKRLEFHAKTHNLEYRSAKIKVLSSRWGSCNQHKDIVLNCYLVQLPWELIDYVLLHELTHTKVLAHGIKFWDELGKYIEDIPKKRKLIKAHRPTLIPQ